MLEKTELEELPQALDTLLTHIQNYKKEEIGNPDNYVSYILPEVLKQTNPEQLKPVLDNLETTLTPHIQHYHDKIGNQDK